MTAAPIAQSPFLPVEGSINLRDMGGYASRTGGRVKHGMLYRSGGMASLSEAGQAQIRALGIHTICDFRRTSERERFPTLWWKDSATVYWTRDHEDASGVLGELIADDSSTPETMRDAMIAIYLEIPVEHAASYREMFDRLLAGHVPLLFNCAAGKDRTGVAGVLLLHALDVPRETIIEDYLLTNQAALALDNRQRRDPARAAKIAAYPELFQPLLTADTAYLDALFGVLDARYGGIDGYLETVLGVDADARARLRALLVD